MEPVVEILQQAFETQHENIANLNIELIENQNDVVVPGGRRWVVVHVFVEGKRPPSVVALIVGWRAPPNVIREDLDRIAR